MCFLKYWKLSHGNDQAQPPKPFGHIGFFKKSAISTLWKLFWGPNLGYKSGRKLLSAN